MSEENFMLYVAGGKLSFKCNNEVWPAPRKECRGNMFHKDAKGGFVCNSCGARYADRCLRPSRRDPSVVRSGS